MVVVGSAIGGFGGIADGTGLDVIPGSFLLSLRLFVGAGLSFKICWSRSFLLLIHFMLCDLFVLSLIFLLISTYHLFCFLTFLLLLTTYSVTS